MGQNLLAKPLADRSYTLWDVPARAPATTRGAVPEMLRGTVVTHRRRCGKPNCHCATGGELHSSVVLSYSDKNKTKFVMLRDDEVAQVRAAIRRFKAAREKLDAAADKGLKQLIASRQRRS